jgi:AAA family ATP:ADP antiporter
MVAGGLATPWLVALAGTANLLFVSAVGLGGSLLCLRDIAREHPDLDREAGDERAPSGLLALARHRYTMWIFLVAVCGVGATRLVDYTFLDRAHLLHRNEDELARFFGLFYGLSQALTLGLLTFVTGPLLTRFGVTTALGLRRLALTGCVGAGAVVLVVAPASAGPLWLAMAAKLADLVLLGAVTTPAFLVLYQPLRPDRRLTTQLAVEGVIGPLASAAAAGAILLLDAVGWQDPRAVAALTLALILAWRSIGQRTNRGYREALPEALANRRLEGVAMPLEEGDLGQILRQRLHSPRPHEALYALDLLLARPDVDAPALLGPLLDHAHAVVRHDVLRRLADLDAPQLIDDVRERVGAETDPAVLGQALLTLAELEESDAVDLLGVFLDYPEPAVADAAIVGMLRSGGIDGVLVAGERLLSLERSPSPDDRERAARILGDVGVRGFYRHLLDLVWDPDPAVRQAALIAAGKVGNPRLWPALVDNLDSVAFHAHAARALVDAGEAALPPLAEALGNPEASVLFRARVAGVLGRIGGDAAVDLLRLRMDSEDRRLRTAVLQALERAGYRAGSRDRGNIDDILWQELADAAWIVAAIVDIGRADAEATGPLVRALEHRLRQVRQRCLLLLAFLRDPVAVKSAAEQLDSRVAARRAYALEVLETTLGGDLRSPMMTLFENPPAAQARRRLATSFPQRLLGRSQRLSLLISPSGHRFEEWIRACAVRAAGWLGDAELAPEVAGQLDDPSRLVSETATWSLRALSDELWAAHETRIVEESLVPPELLFWIESWKPGERPMFLTVEKVMILRSVGVFADVPEEVLAELAGFLEEIEVAEDERVYEKGALGRTMYIIADGRVRVHDDERTFIELGTGEIFGELTTLDPEPHSASVTALADTRLLGLDRDTLYELMSAHPTVLRGLIHVLCGRLRGKSR